MKRLILIFAAFFTVVSLNAQSAVQQADAAFSAGNYADAAQLYELAATTVAGNEAERQKLYDKANRCRQVASIKSKADRLYREGDYKAAVEVYESVLKYNSRDQRAKSRIAEYEMIVLAAENAAADSAAWNNVVSRQYFLEKAVAAEEYLAAYPRGRHAEEAALYVAEKNLWNEAAKFNTYESYEHYKQMSALRYYIAEADRRIKSIEAEAWAEARKKNTVAAFQKYIADNKDRGTHLDEAQDYIYLLTARDNYDKDNLVEAYNYYKKCSDEFMRKNYADKSKMEECEEYYYFQRAASGTIEDCNYYLNKRWYDYRKEVRNRKMLLLCERQDYDRAMDYADTPAAKKFVRESRKQWKKNNRH